MTKNRVVSGIRPTGSVHLGNYLGAIKGMVALQHAYDSFCFIADLHAITDSQDPKHLAEHTLNTAALLLACGLDPKQGTLFVQSHVHAHAEMAQLLSAVASMANLKSMIQFKEKSETSRDTASVGLFTYPILMASDILLYAPHLVPVGADQRQHLELARKLADRFNDTYAEKGTTLLRVPSALEQEAGARVMSLTDGSKKMSKSDPSDQSRINLLDTPDTIAYKIKRAKTDAVVGLEFDETRPEVFNLLTIYQLVSGKNHDAVAAECKSLGFGKFKPLLTDALVAHLEPIQKRYSERTSDKSYLSGVLQDGRRRAHAIAQKTLMDARRAMGFYQVD